MIIYGSRMYGKKNVVHSHGVCPHCSRHVKQKSYDGRKWGHLYFIPLIPSGGHVRVLKECGKCGMGQHIPQSAVHDMYQHIEATMPLVVEAAAADQRVCENADRSGEIATGPFVYDAIDVLVTTNHEDDVAGIFDLLEQSGAAYELALGRSAYAEVRGESHQAQTHMKEAQAAAPDEAMPLLKLAEYAGRSGDAAAQLGYLQEARTLTDDDPSVMLEMAGPLEALGRFDELVEVLDDCIAMVPELGKDKKFMKLRKKYSKKAMKA